ncbi:MAG: deoxyribodipyrimidine photo-lyase [Erythrobacter sp.]|uniref:cryptochrome/photolyase family protein n=1 Tax=Erythrobacter sp. TaxID=1042 RepID=UPI003266FC7A
MTETQIVWLRRDLRLADNPALYEAAQRGPVICVYVLDDAAAKTHAYGGASRWWLHHSLADLAVRLEERGSTLILRKGDCVEELSALSAELGGATIHANHHYEPWWRNVEKALGEKVSLERYHGNFLTVMGAIKTGSGGQYKIYTPFSRAVRTQFPPRDLVPEPELTVPATWPASDILLDWSLLPAKPDWSGGIAEAWEVGEEAAHERLEWWSDHVDDYDEARNLPSIERVSRLSPHLHFGEITPVQIWHHFQGRSTKGWEVYESELIWRDYAQNTAAQFPLYARSNYREDFDHIQWRDPESDPKAAKDLKKWQQGRTGYPIVDAGMRELWQTGWMHNRVRMITASFLVKHLLIDWRHGEQWFWDTLLDADYASNATNWQWTAGTGVDSNMFVRIMAPLTQSEKFDCTAYIRKFVPELAGLDEPYIHDPEEFGRLPKAYQPKMIGHKAARERALAAYRVMKGS